MLFIARICTWQSPFILGFLLLAEDVDSVHGQRAVSRELGRVSDVNAVQSPLKGILILGPWVIGDLDPRFILRDIMVDVQVGTLIKSVMERFGCWCREIVMNIGEAMTLALSERHPLSEFSCGESQL